MASSVCSPSRSALLTGLYPVATGIYPGVLWPNSIGGLAEAHLTLANYLADIGYSTAHAGKWHLGVGESHQFLPTKRGFDHYLGIPYSHDMCPCSKCFHAAHNTSCHDTCRPDFVGCPLFLDDTIIEQPTDLTSLTSKVTDFALNFIDGAADKPYFLYMAYHQTHHPQFASKCCLS